MKKLIGFLANIVVLCILFSGCSNSNNETINNDISQIQVEYDSNITTDQPVENKLIAISEVISYSSVNINNEIIQGQIKYDSNMTVEVLENNEIITTSEVIVSGNELAYGGSIRNEYLTKYEFLYNGLDTFLYEIVDKEVLDTWRAQFKSESNLNGRNPREQNTHNAIKELGISKDEFIKINNEVTYTAEQVEAFYTDDIKTFNQAFANPFALLIDDTIYTIDWLATRTSLDYKQKGITEEVLAEYLDGIRALSLQEDYRAIKGVINKTKKSKGVSNENIMETLSKTEISAPFRYELYGIDNFIYEIVDAEKLHAWMNQFLYEGNESPRHISECNVANLVLELNIPEETFTKANNGIVYTKEQIKAIYSGMQKEINKAFVNDYALLINDNIYTIHWLSMHTLQDYEREGITVKTLEKFLGKLEKKYLKDDKEYAHISSVLNKMRE